MAGSTRTQPLVLVADPDVEYVALMTRHLEWAGYEVITTGDARDAGALVEERRPDALVLEAMLPGASGYAVVRRIREQPHNLGLPIVMVSTRAGKLDRDFAFTVGADDYIRKPAPYSKIVARLADLAPAAPVTAQPIARQPRVRQRVAQPALARQ